MQKSFFSQSIQRYQKKAWTQTEDELSIEEPLEIRLEHSQNGVRQIDSISITMRTPGHDFELAAGFLFVENIIDDPNDIIEIDYCGEKEGDLELYNNVKVSISPDVTVDLEKLQRHFFTNSSCGICGKSSLEQIRTHCSPITDSTPLITPEQILKCPEYLYQKQSNFSKTGGLHASALFDLDLNIVECFEDVGRHNALDKLIGCLWLSQRLPIEQKILLLSGRTSFELVQKASRAHIPIILSIGAPSNLAVQMAIDFNITLIGFITKDKFNVYNGAERIKKR